MPGFEIDRRASDPLAEEGDEAVADLAGPMTGAVGDAPLPANYHLSAETWTLSDATDACNDDVWAPFDIGRTLGIATEVGIPTVGFDLSHPDLLAVWSGDIAFVRYQVTIGDLERGGGEPARPGSRSGALAPMTGRPSRRTHRPCSRHSTSRNSIGSWRPRWKNR